MLKNLQFAHPFAGFSSRGMVSMFSGLFLQGSFDSHVALLRSSMLYTKFGQKSQENLGMGP